MSHHLVEPMSHVPRPKRNMKTGRVTWQLSMDVETRVAKFNHVTSCPPLKIYSGEMYEPWNVHLPIRGVYCSSDLTKFCTSWFFLITVYTRIYTLWTHTCFVSTCAISHLILEATDSHREIFVRCTLPWLASAFHILFLLENSWRCATSWHHVTNRWHVIFSIGWNK